MTDETIARGMIRRVHDYYEEFEEGLPYRMIAPCLNRRLNYTMHFVDFLERYAPQLIVIQTLKKRVVMERLTWDAWSEEMRQSFKKYGTIGVYKMLLNRIDYKPQVASSEGVDESMELSYSD